jgi:hypothetical protein
VEHGGIQDGDSHRLLVQNAQIPAREVHQSQGPLLCMPTKGRDSVRKRFESLKKGAAALSLVSPAPRLGNLAAP